MGASRLSSADAKKYTQRLQMRADTLGVDLNDCILVLGLDNDTRVGGDRHAIVTYSQKMAKKGATYGQVLNNEVPLPGGGTHKIVTNDLAGFICANGFCKLIDPNTKLVINP